MSESRQQRRARERLKAKREHVSARVTGSPSIQRLWLTYYDEVLVPRGITLDDPELASGVRLFRSTFYAGAASMFELLTRVAPDHVSEDQGVEMLSRLHDELETYAKGLGREPKN